MSLKIYYLKIQRQLNKNGYVVLKNFLSKSTCENLYKKIMSYKSTVDDEANFHQGASMIYNLQNKNEAFLKLIFNKKINKICQNYFLGGAHKRDKNIYQFDSLHSRILFGKTKPQNLHIDSRICGVFPPTHIHFFIYLKKVRFEDGPTQIVPKSHKINRYPKKSDNIKAKKFTGDQGTIIALNSSIWHGSSKKNSFNPRAILTLSFSRWHIRQAFAIPYGLPKKFAKKISKKEKILLGFYNYSPASEKIRARMRGELTTLKVQ